MKKLLKPYTVSIEVNSLSSISNEQWISLLYRLDMKKDVHGPVEKQIFAEDGDEQHFDTDKSNVNVDSKEDVEEEVKSIKSRSIGM